MRLGCEVTAVDINPVAWFILKCTLEYPQKLAGQKPCSLLLSLKIRRFHGELFKAQGFKGALLTCTQLEGKLGLGENPQPQLTGLKIEEATLEADLAWHVRAWGWWVLQKAKADLERFYPVVDGKPTVAYLWARTVKCKNCRATISAVENALAVQERQKTCAVDDGAERGEDRCGLWRRSRPMHHFSKVVTRRNGANMINASALAPCPVPALPVPCCTTIMTIEDIRLEGTSWTSWYGNDCCCSRRSQRQRISATDRTGATT